MSNRATDVERHGQQQEQEYYRKKKDMNIYKKIILYR
jgi:hypothetical protein